MTDSADAPPEIPDPASCRRPGATGVPATMGDGREWLLARCGLARGLAPVRDAMFDSLVVYDEVAVADLLQAAYYAIRLNYDLPDEALAALVRSTPAAALVDAAVEAVLPTCDGRERSYTDWARSSLLANGIRPADVPPDDLRAVLDQLVQTGRAAKLDTFVESARHAKARATLRSLKGDQDRERERAAMLATD